MFMWGRVAFLVVNLLLSISVWAQDKNDFLKFSHLTVEDGLSDNYSESILETSDGYLWIGTNDGLCRYDGTEFRTYKYDKNDSLSLRSNFIFRLFEDSKKQLWVGTNMGGLARYNHLTDNFTSYQFDAVDSVWHQRNRINEIVEHEGKLWLATMYGLGLFDPETGLSEWYLPKSFTETLPPHQTMTILLDPNENLWVGTLYGGMFYFDTQKRQFVKQYLPDSENLQSISNVNVKRIYISKQQKMYVATEEGGLNLFEPQTETFKRYMFDPSDQTSISSNDVLNFCEDSYGRFWIGTINGGLNLFDPESETFQHFQPQKNNTTSINSRSISTIIEDRFGNIWLSTHGGGVNYISPRRNSILHLHTQISKDLGSNIISSLCEHDGRIWVGTDGAGLHYMDAPDWDVFAVPESCGLNSKAILDIIPASKGLLWIATWGGGFSLFDCEKLTVVKQYRKGNGTYDLNIDDIKGLCQVGDTLWVAGHGRGVNMLTLSTGEFVNTLNNTNAHFDMLRPEWGNDVFVDSERNVWFPACVGLHKLVGDSLVSYYESKIDSTSLQGFLVSCVFESQSGDIWVGTNAGLSYYNKETDNFTFIPELPSKIKAVLEDEDNTLWVSSNSGLYSYNPTTKKVRKLDISYGLQGSQFSERSALKLTSGHLLFGGINGLNIFHPDSIFVNTKVIKTNLTSLKLFDKAQLPLAESSVLTYDINQTDKVTLEYNQNVVSFEFSGINLIESAGNKYVYKLEGFDKEWRYAHNDREASYTNLLPGKYTFNVKTTNEDGLESTYVKTVELEILAPWWMTLWFMTLAILLILLVGYLVVRWRIRSVKIKNAELEEKVKERTHALQEAHIQLTIKSDEVYAQNAILETNTKALSDANEELITLNQTKDKFISIIAHDIKNPMGVILGFAQLALHRFGDLTSEKHKQYLEMIEGSASNLNDMVLKLLDWGRSQTNSISIEPEEFMLQSLFERNLKIAEASAKKKNIAISITTRKDYSLWADSTMIDTVVRNLISNAIKFTTEGGFVTLSVREMGDLLQLSVTDNGVGMSKEKVNNLFQIGVNNSTNGTANESGTGLGLLICSDFVQQNGGELTVTSEEGLGTSFKFTVPRYFSKVDEV